MCVARNSDGRGGGERVLHEVLHEVRAGTLDK